MGKTMAGRKRSLLEQFISGLASATSDTPKKRGTRVSPKGTYKTKGSPKKELLGSGMARKAAASLSGRGAQLEEQERGIIGR